ncbi:hypothetical protein F5Y18DRAFT_187519 [Xylariaceae sp. FL1019]|nr:hypothetical protein F5Y18DRAFT_187519 [Xylariaceae sp. FL1019]
MQEFPIPHTYCRGPKTCSVGETMGSDVGIQYDGAQEYQGAFEDGISGGFFGRKENVHMKGASVDVKEGQCGYFAWIGTKREVCGSLTEPVDPGHCTGPKKTTQNVCVEDMFSGPLGMPDNYAATVFVYLDCNTRLPLPADQQSYLFSYDGVAFDTNLLDTRLQADVATECTMKNNFLWYAWSMKGRGLKDDKLGPSGSGLLANIRHCGVDITGWTFKYTPDDYNYDWHASGNISPFTMACPGKALKETGANSANC